MPLCTVYVCKIGTLNQTWKSSIWLVLLISLLLILLLSFKTGITGSLLCLPTNFILVLDSGPCACVESTLATEPSLQLHFLFSLFSHSWYELSALIHSIFSFKLTVVNFIIHTLMAESYPHQPFSHLYFC